MASPNKVATRPLGKSGPLVPRMGLGLMGASVMYGPSPPDNERMAFLDQAYNMGETFWDTADVYGDSEDLLGKWFAAHPERRKDIFLATKFGIRSFGEDYSMNSSPEYCREALGKSLKRLGLPYVDLYYVHRLDKVTPIEATIQAMAALVNAGKIKYIGLSECSADTLRRAHVVHPVSCVQMEYSPFCLDIESPKYRLLETARELGIAIVAYSPLGNGLLGGAIRSKEDLSKPGDVRRDRVPWFNDNNLEKNLAIVDEITALAKARGMTTPQMSIAWLLAQGDDIFPIPGTAKVHRLAENLASLDISLSPEEENAIRQLSERVTGARYLELSMEYCFADTPPLEH